MRPLLAFFLMTGCLGIFQGSHADEIGDLIGTLNKADGVSRQISRKTSNPFYENQCPPGESVTEKSRKETFVVTPERGGYPISFTVFTKEEAQKLFEEVVQPRTRKMELRDFVICKQRAETIAYEMHQKGIQSGKLFVSTLVGSVDVQSEALKPYFQSAGFHVSNVIAVQGKEGKPELYVMDPFLFPSGPVPKAEFDKVFSPGFFQRVDLDSEYAYDISDRFMNLKKHEPKNLMEAHSVVDGNYASNDPIRRVMSVEERERYLRLRAQELGN